MKRTVVTSVSSFLLLSAAALGQQAGPEPEATRYVLEFLDEQGNVELSEDFATRAEAENDLKNWQEMHDELGWGALNAEIRPEADIVAGKVGKFRPEPKKPLKLRVA